MPVATRHDPRCVGSRPHRPCFGTQALVRRTAAWVAFPFADCNLSDLDGFCYTHASPRCEAIIAAWDRAHCT